MLDQGMRALLVLPMVLVLVACGGIADEFLPDSSDNKLVVTVQRALNTSPDNVTEYRSNDRLRFGRALLAPTLPPDVEVHVGVSASRYGTYRFGSGWITSGDLYLGRHSVATETVEVRSSDSNVVTAELVPDPTDPGRKLVKPITHKPGVARIGVKVSKVDKNRQRIDGLVEDSLVLTVKGGLAAKETRRRRVPWSDR